MIHTKNKLAGLMLSTVLATAGISAGAQAADLLTPTEVEVEESRFDISFGATLASEYIFRGITQTDNNPAIQGFIEASYGMFYIAAWGSNLDFNTPDPDVEIDFYGGIRPTFGIATFDIGLLRYQYPNASPLNFTEVYGKVSLQVTEPFSVGGGAYYSFDIGDEDSLYLEANASYALPYNFSVSAALGHQSFDDAIGATDYTTWNAGVSYAITDWASADLRYYDNDLAGSNARIVGSISLSSSLSSLKKAGVF
jgi:uncharacterized protein (TIGR02001 family)